MFESADLSKEGMNKLISDGQVEENLHNQQESVSDIWPRIGFGTLLTQSILTSVQSSNLLYKTVDGGVAFVAALLN